MVDIFHTVAILSWYMCFEFLDVLSLTVILFTTDNFPQSNTLILLICLDIFEWIIMNFCTVSPIHP